MSCNLDGSIVSHLSLYRWYARCGGAGGCSWQCWRLPEFRRRARADGYPAKRSSGVAGPRRPAWPRPRRRCAPCWPPGIDDGLVGDGPRDASCSRTASPPRLSPSSKRPRKPDPPDYAACSRPRGPTATCGRYDDAARLAREGARRFRRRSVWPLLLSLVLSDAGRTAGALAVLRTPAAQRAPAGRAADGRGLRLAARRQPAAALMRLWRGGAAVARQSRRAATRRPASCSTWARPSAPR